PFGVCAHAARVNRLGASAGAAQRAIKRRRVSMAVPPCSRYYHSIPLRRPHILGERSRLPIVADRISNRSAAPLTCSANGAELDRRRRATRLLVDEGRSRRADHLVLGPGAAGTADGADDLAVLDQRDAAA